MRIWGFKKDKIKNAEPFLQRAPRSVPARLSGFFHASGGQARHGRINQHSKHPRRRFTALSGFKTLTLAMTLAALFASPAMAVCSNNEDGNPGVSGEIEYFTATNELMYCDDTNWILMTWPSEPIPADSSTNPSFNSVVFVNGADPFRAGLANQFFVQNAPFYLGSIFSETYQTVNDGLIGHWKLDETTGTTAIDSSGNGNDGNMLNGVDAATDSTLAIMNTGIDFAGVDARVQVPYDSSLVPSSNNMTIAFWMKPSVDWDDEANDAWIFAATQSGVNNYSPGFRLFVNGYIGEALGVYMGGAGSDRFFGTGGLDWDANRWYHIAYSYEASTYTGRWYRDGVLIASPVGAAFTPDWSTNDLHIGDGYYNGDMEGIMDDVRMYNRVLDDYEILQLYSTVPDYTPNTVYFDGTNDYLTSTSITGLADGKRGTVSVWFNVDDLSDQHYIFEAHGFRFAIYVLDTQGRIHVNGRDTSNTSILSARTDDNSIIPGKWHHLLASWDLSEGATPGTCTTCHIYLDGVAPSGAGGFATYTDANLDYTRSDYAVGAQNTTNNKWAGSVADFWFDFDTNIDFAVESNRRKFITQAGHPAWLGTDGSVPTGSQPDIFLSGDTVNWHTNKGPGGGFTENGALTDGATIAANGLIGHWKLDETTGSSIADSAPTGNTGTWTDGGDNNVSGETATGIVNNALTFPGDINAGSNATMDNIYSGNGMSVCSWVYPESVPGAQAPIVNKDGSSFGNYGWSMYLNKVGGNTIEFYANHDNYIAPNVTYTLNAWQHICFTWDGTDGSAGLTAYVNGVEPSGTTYLGDQGATVFDDSSYDINIGYNDHDSTLFDGLIDDVRIYDRVISAAEVAGIYQDGLGDLIGHWKLDETSGTTAADSSGYGNNGTMNGSMDATNDSVSGIVDTALDFDGTNDNIAISDNTIYEVQDSFSASVWFKIDATSANDQRILFKEHSVEPFVAWELTVNNGSNEIMFLLSNTTSNSGTPTSYIYEGTNPITAGVWYHIVAVKDGGDLHLYLNGVEDEWYTNEPYTGTPIDSDGDFEIGGDGGVRSLNGQIDDVRIYDYALTATEAQNLYLQASNGLVGHWRLDETSGTTAADSSVFGNDGTMNGGLDAGNDSTAGIINTSLDFDGVDDDIEVSNSYNLAEFTTCGWVYLNTTDNMAFVSKFEDTTNGWWVEYDAGNIFIKDDIGSPGSDTSLYSTAVNTQEWFHFCAGIDSQPRNFLYLNGTLIANNDTPSGSWDTITASEIFIGQRGNNTKIFNGRMDDVRVYGRALTASEAQSLYNQGFQDLVGHWRLDETSGTAAADSSIYGNDGTMNGGQDAANDSTNGVLDTALNFDGVDDVINAGSDTSIDDVFATGGTVSAWIYPRSAGEGDFGSILRKSPSINNDGWGWSMGGWSGSDDESMNFYSGCTTSGTLQWYTADGSVPYNQWHHVAVTFNQSSITNDPTYYINGVAVSSTETGSCTGAFDSDASQDLRIGDLVTVDRAFDGEIDDVRIYSRELTATEIQDLYNSYNNALVGHWKLDETSGTTAVDSSSYGNDGTMNGGLDASNDSINGIVDTAFNLDGTNDVITFASANNIFDNASEMSTCAWVKVNSFNSDSDIIGDFNSNGGVGWLFFVDTSALISGATNTITFNVDGGTTTSERVEGTTDLVELNKWDHYCGTFSGGNFIRLYKNGVLISEEATSIVSNVEPSPATNLRIGRRTNGGGNPYFDGSLDDVRIYNRALTAAEILELYNKPNEALIGHWKLDETSGTTAADSSQYGNDGTYTNITLPADSGDGVYDTAVNFEFNIGEYVQAPTSPIYTSTKELTYAAWIKPTGFDNYHGILELDGIGALYFSFNTNNLAFTSDAWSTQAGVWRVNNAANVDEWTHVAVTYSYNDVIGTQPEFYINGQSVAISNTAFSPTGTYNAPATSTANIGLLTFSGNRAFQGYIDDARIYNRVLTATEIQDLYDNANLALVGHWKLDETSGSAITDSSWTNSDGTYRTSTTSTTLAAANGFIDGAVTFDDDNTNNVLINGNPDAFNMTDEQAFTISSWVNYRGLSGDLTNYIFQRGVGPNGTTDASYFFRIYSPGVLSLQLNDGSVNNSFDGTGTVPINEWAHVAVTWDGNNVSYYINGSLTETDPMAITLIDNATATGIAGRSTSLAAFDGEIDDMRVYNKALSATEIQEIYDTSLGGLVAHYKLDETSGTTAVDSTPEGNDGTMNGGLDAGNDRVDGPMGTALNFDGADDDISMASLSVPIANGITMTAWVNPNSLSGLEGIVRARTNIGGSNDNSTGIVIRNSNPFVVTELDAFGTDTGLDLPLNQWSFVAITSDSTGRVVYRGTSEPTLDSYALAASAGYGDGGANFTGFSIGNDAGFVNREFDGGIDDVRIYNRVLNATELEEIYNAGDPPVPDLDNGLIGHWALDETSGTTAADSSGNGNDLDTIENITIASATTTGIIDNGFEIPYGPYDSIEIYGNNIFPVVTDQPFTISLWAYDMGGTNANILTVGDNDIRIFRNLSHIRADIEGGTNIDMDHTSYYNKWTLLTLTYDGTDAKFYRISANVNNGQIDEIESGAGNGATFTPDNGDFSLGATNGAFGESLNVIIDDVRLYNRAITEKEIEILAGCTGPGSYYYNFSDDVMQWCDGVASARDMGPDTIGDGTNVCDVFGTPNDVPLGGMEYLATGTPPTMYYCPGENPIPIGRSCTECGGNGTSKVVFISQTYTEPMNYGGLAGADAFCQADAVANGLSGTYLAWMTDSNAANEPATRFSADIRGGAYSIVMTNGTIVANDWADLTDGTIDNPILVGPNGARTLMTENRVTSNVDTDGTQLSGTNHCANYSANSGSAQGGDPFDSTASWTDNGGIGCTFEYRFYCFEQ